ncbi:MAG: SRPBCC family protein [Aeromicrobium sp.]|uniref:SRPBCC family protein n=1 Tax=Aeromicrobium sp. TaxID=1871063 RepID=UPI0025C0910F|nr:SRPBCC family protein [Aeromicrobium sp.]MCK5890212.1 SRPBCC family protein [Aeromicrobium sp.]MDF1703742.1 SRPBCC family protein [Aeromicrobium sp.]
MVNRDIITDSIEIAAPPAVVWALVSDLKRMGEWSPQCRRMIVRGGEVAQGTRTININRQGWKVWPTRSYVKVFEPERTLALKIAENGTIWTYELEPVAGGTRLTESRTAPNGVSSLSNFLSKRVLGGTENFEAELERGIQDTLARIKHEAEKTHAGRSA